MAFHGSAVCNQTPILFKGNNRATSINMIIHNDESGSMDDVNQFFSDGDFISFMQDALLAESIGDDTTRFPNLYSYFGLYSRNYSTNISITNQNGSLLVQNTFMKGESSGAQTKTNWLTSYFNNIGNFFVNICNQNNRLDEFNPLNTGFSPYTEDVHGNLWSIFTTPNSIISGTPGRYGSILSSSVRIGSRNIIITASDEQSTSPIDMIDANLTTSVGQRAINGNLGEILIREYKVISLNSYSSSDSNDGVLFYGSTSSQPYGYVRFTSPSTFTLTRSTIPPTNWNPTTGGSGGDQKHDMLTICEESNGGLFKINNVFTNSGTDNRVAFTTCIAQFLSETL